MRVTRLIKRLDSAISKINDEFAVQAKGSGDRMYANGLRREGYLGGYIQALRDVEGLARDIEPGTSGIPYGVWDYDPP